MYTVSDEYKIKMLDQVQTHALSGTIDSISFTGGDVIGVSYTAKCADKKVNIGGVNIGTLKLTFLTDILNRGDYFGKEITISDSLLIGYDDDDDPIWESVPLGTFYVAEATWRAEGMVDIVAYDCLSKMDKNIDIDTSSGTVYGFCKFIETQTGATFGMTQAECEAFPNGTELIALYEQNDLETYRDLLSALAQMVGGFAYAAKDGTWKLRTFDDTSVLAIPKNRRFSGARYSDFTTLYDAISYVDVATGLLNVIGDADGVVLKLGSNPFLQYGSSDAISRRAWAIVDAVEKIAYTPFQVGLLPAFIALDLGDVISFTNDYAEETTTGAVMNLTWTYNKSFKVYCYGDNPDLQSSQSKTEKNISGLLRNTTDNEVTYYNFTNVDSITFGSEQEVDIASLAFTSAQRTTVKILHEFIFDMLADLSEDCSYEIRYYLDEALVAYKPYERIKGVQGLAQGDTEFSITRDLFYILKDVEPNVRHTWRVAIITHGVDSTTIDVNHAHVTLEGQRLYGEKYFDGYVEVKDDITLVPLGYLSLVSITDSVSLSTYALVSGAGSDNIDFLNIDYVDLLNIQEGTGALSPHIYFQTVFGYILTEDEDYLTTDSGDRLIL